MKTQCDSLKIELHGRVFQNLRCKKENSPYPRKILMESRPGSFNIQTFTLRAFEKKKKISPSRKSQREVSESPPQKTNG